MAAMMDCRSVSDTAWLLNVFVTRQCLDLWSLVRTLPVLMCEIASVICHVLIKAPDVPPKISTLIRTVWSSLIAHVACNIVEM